MWGTLLAHPSAILPFVHLIGVLVYPFMTRMTAKSGFRRAGTH